MKILLANPPCIQPLADGMELAFVRAGSRWPFSDKKERNKPLNYIPFPFYLAYLASLLRKDGHEVEVIDSVALNENREDFLNHLQRLNVDFIFFETATPTIDYDLKLAEDIRKITNARIALAGAHATTFAEEILSSSSPVDFVFRNEYEISFRDMVRALSEGKDLKNLKGFSMRNGDGSSFSLPSTDLVDLAHLESPARDLFPCNDKPDIGVYWDGFCQFRPAIQMHASRGCPFKCNFCLWNQVMYGEGKYRIFEASKVVDEMEKVVEKHGAREIYFDDDTFTGNKAHVLQVADEIMRRNLKIRWSCMGDAMITDAEMISAMARSGCIGMKFGVESGSEKILKIIQKPVRFDRVKEVARTCAREEIKTHATFTFGLSGETFETMEETLECAKNLDVDSVQFSITTPFPGTRYFTQCDSQGTIITKDWNKYDGSRSSVVEFEGLSHERVEEFCRTATTKWLRRKLKDPKWILRQIYYLNRVRKGQGNKLFSEKIFRAIKTAFN